MPPPPRAARRDRVVRPAVAVGTPGSGRRDPRHARRRRRFRIVRARRVGYRPDHRGPRPRTRRVPASGPGASTRSGIPARTTWCPTCSLRPDCSTGSARCAPTCRCRSNSAGGASRPRRPLTEGTYDAARGAVDIALSATASRARRRRPRVRPVPPARPSRPDGDVRRLLLLQQRRGRRAPRRRRRPGRESPCSTSTTTTATARSRSSTPATTSSTCRSTAIRHGRTRTSPGSPTRRGAGRGSGRHLNVPLAAHTDDDALHRRAGARLRGDRRVRPGHGRSCRSASTRTTPIRSPTSPSPPTGSDGRARWSAELARPTVVLQEGGYDVATLGDNARRWLLGLAAIRRDQVVRRCQAPMHDLRTQLTKPSDSASRGDGIGVFEFDADETVELGELLGGQRSADLVDRAPAASSP